MRRALTAALPILLGIAPAAAAQDEPFTLAALGLKGQAIYKNFSFFEETPTDERHFYNEGILLVEWSRSLASWSDARLVLEARADDDDYARGITFQIPDTSERRSMLALKELSLSARGGPLDVTAGKQIFAWGTADAYNPTDLLNPYDYMDAVDNEKLGIWSVAARATFGPTSLVFVIVPFFTPSRTPLVGSRWNPPPPPGVIVDNREVPGRELANMQYAARLRTTVRGIDLSVSYYDGFDDLPEIRVQSQPDAAGLVVPVFTPVFPRIRVPGADVSTTLGKFELHAEAAFRFVDHNGRQDTFQAIAGLNYTFDDFDLRWLEQVLVVLEYARAEPLSSHRHDDIVEVNALGPGAFRNAPVARVSVKFTEETQLKLTALLDLTGPTGYYTQAKVTHKLTDAVHVEAGLEFMGGAAGTFWGRFGDNDRFFFLARYYF